jgi:hypothetical protein
MTTSAFDVAVETGGVLDPESREKIRNPAPARTARPITENNMTGIRDWLRAGSGNGSGLMAGSDFGIGSGFAVGLSSGTGASFMAGSGSVSGSGLDGAGASLGTAMTGFSSTMVGTCLPRPMERE